MTARRLPRSTPESQGVDPDALQRLIDTFDGVHDVHSLMVLRHGHVVVEGWWEPFAPDEPHRMFSVSKSVTATAVGIAVAEGLLTIDDRVVDLLPDDAPSDPGERLAAMTVRHLLTMTSGHGTDTLNFTLRNLHRPGQSWAHDILAAPVVHEPGTRFVYNTGATYLLSAILHRLTGRRLLDYVTPRLFAPLGITGATWEQDPRGIDVGGYGLAITTEDLALLGQLWLQRGTWQGTELVRASWVDEMSAAQVPNGPNERPDWEQGYGYQFWRCRDGAYRADGAFGQLAVVSPEHDAVVVVTSGTTATHLEVEAIMAALDEAFVGADHGQGAVSSAADGGALELTGRQVALPQGAATSPSGVQLDGVSFVLGPHPLAAGADRDDAAADGALDPGSPDQRGRSFLRWHTLAVRHRTGDGTVDGAADEIELRWTREPGGERGSVRCGVGCWVAGRARVDDEEVPVAGAAAWTAPDRLTVRLLWRGTPFALEITLVVGGGSDGRWVEVTVDQNVSFGPTELLRATGREVAAV